MSCPSEFDVSFCTSVAFLCWSIFVSHGGGYHFHSDSTQIYICDSYTCAAVQLSAIFDDVLS